MNTSKTTHSPLGLLMLSLLGLSLLLMAIPKTWEDATKTNDDGTLSLSDDWAGTIEKKIEKYEVHDLYMLIAAADGYFLCGHCPAGKFFLKKAEVYRYGTTGDGQAKRGYNREWLTDNRLAYIRLKTGDLKTAKIAEATLIGSYALLSENLQRPLLNSTGAKPYWYRLVLPPGNNSLD